MATVLYCLCRLYFSINKTNWMEIIMAHQNDISWHQFDTTEMSIDARRRHHERDSLENKHYDSIKIRSENCQCMITRKPKRSWCEYERNGFFSNLLEIIKKVPKIVRNLQTFKSDKKNGVFIIFFGQNTTHPLRVWFDLVFPMNVLHSPFWWN